MSLRGHEEIVIACIFFPDGERLATYSWDGTTKFWELTSGLCEVTAVGQIRGIAPDGCTMPCNTGNRLGLWKWEPAEFLQRLPVSARFLEGGISPDGRWYAFVTDKELEILDLKTRKRVASAPIGGVLRGVAFASDGRSIVGATATQVIRWPVRVDDANGVTLETPNVLLNRATWHMGVLLAPDGKHLAHISGYDNFFWHNGETKKDVFKWNDHPGVSSVSISPDQQWLATGTFQGEGVKIRSLKTKAIVKEIPDAGSAGATFSPNGKWLVTSSADSHSVWESGTWQLIRTHRRRGVVNWGSCATFSPDSRFLAMDASPTTIQIVHAESGREVISIETPPTRFFHAIQGLTRNADTLIGGTPSAMHAIWDLRALRGKLRELNLDWDDRAP
jgi:WD40 repeat protein